MKIQKNDGFTLIELLIVVAIIGIIAAIAVPGLLRARMSGNETSAIGSIRAINTAQVNFSASCGGGFYADSLASLGTPPTASPSGEVFISPDLGSVGSPAIASKSGYNVTIAAGAAPPTPPVSCNATPVVMTYWASADPAQAGSTGQRFFGGNQNGTVFFSSAAALPVTQTGSPAGGTAIQ